MKLGLSSTFFLLSVGSSSAFTTSSQPVARKSSLDASNVHTEWLRGGLTAAAIFVGSSAFAPVAWCDEYGKETEAPTLYTGETIEVG